MRRKEFCKKMGYFHNKIRKLFLNYF